jgi:DNA-binding NarL/FixJ family response regulator
MASPIISRCFKGVEEIRVLIAERDRMASQLLAESLQRDSRFKVVATPPVAELVSVATLRQPDIAVISADFVSGAKKGFQIARALSTRLPDLRIVILLDTLAREPVLASFRAGARGVFCRTEPLSEFRTCVQEVSHGEIWARSTAGEHLVEAVKISPSCDAIDETGTLSRREIEVVECAVQGQTNKQIAGQLGLSEHTVKNYLFRIFEKLRVSSRMELLLLLSTNHKNSFYTTASKNSKNENGTNSLERYLKAAEQGWVSAQFLVGLAYFEGRDAEKNEQFAYYWLRLAEENSVAFRHHIGRLLQEIKTRMTVRDVENLEKSIMAQREKMLTGKKIYDLLEEEVNGENPIRMPAVRQTA